MTREQKIELLNGIAMGTRHINEMLPHRLEFWHHRAGIYISDDTRTSLSETEFAKRLERRSGPVHRVIFKNYSKK